VATVGLVISLTVTLAACGGSAQETRSPVGPGREELKAGTHMLDLVARAEAGTGRARAGAPAQDRDHRA